MMTPRPYRKNISTLKSCNFAFSYLLVMLSAVTGTEALTKHFLVVPPIKIVVCVYVYIYAKLNNESQTFPRSFCAVRSNTSC